MSVKGNKQDKPNPKPKPKSQNTLRPPDFAGIPTPRQSPPRWARFLRALALVVLPPLFIPLSAALLRTLHSVEFELSSAAGTVLSPTSLMFVSGLVISTLFCVAFRNLVLLYLVAHEWTHVLFGWLSGAHVDSVTFAKFGGKALISKSNMMILLSPYFVPFYVLFLLIFCAPISLFVPVYNTIFGRACVFLIGFAWGHHFWWTFAALWQLQPDLREYGCFFSVNLILFANLLVLLLLFGLFTPVPTRHILSIFTSESAAVFTWLYNAATYLAGLIG